MQFVMFAIRDVVANHYLAPFISRSETDAKRQITASLRDPHVKDTPIGSNPKDFELCAIGRFDDDSGILESFPRPTRVALISELSPVPA